MSDIRFVRYEIDDGIARLDYVAIPSTVMPAVLLSTLPVNEVLDAHAFHSEDEVFCGSIGLAGPDGTTRIFPRPREVYLVSQSAVELFRREVQASGSKQTMALEADFAMMAISAGGTELEPMEG